MINTMKDLLVEQVRDLYDAEKRIIEALPKMEVAAHSPELKEAFREHRQETEGQINRLEDACLFLEVAASGETCEATKGLIREAESLIAQLSDPVVGDAALIAAAQRIEHYEIASYSSAVNFANAIDEDRVALLLGKTLDQEKNAANILEKIATGGFFSTGLNEEAADS